MRSAALKHVAAGEKLQASSSADTSILLSTPAGRQLMADGWRIRHSSRCRRVQSRMSQESCGYRVVMPEGVAHVLWQRWEVSADGSPAL